jgi:hypothetical protein
MRCHYFVLLFSFAKALPVPRTSYGPEPEVPRFPATDYRPHDTRALAGPLPRNDGRVSRSTKEMDNCAMCHGFAGSGGAVSRGMNDGRPRTKEGKRSELQWRLPKPDTSCKLPFGLRGRLRQADHGRRLLVVGKGIKNVGMVATT